MRSYVLVGILITCVTFVNIRAWNLRKSEVDLDLALQGDLNGQNICDDKNFPPKKRKKICQIATKAPKGEKPIFEKIFLKNGDKNSCQCEEKLVHFTKTQPAPRKRLVFLCDTDTEDKYYFGTGKNVDEVAIYVDPVDKILIAEDQLQVKEQRKGRSSVEVDESGVRIRSGNESSAADEDANSKRKVKASFEGSEEVESAKHKNQPSILNNKTNVCEEIENESSIDIDKSNVRVEPEKNLPQVIFYGVMENIDLDTLYSIHRRAIRFVKKLIPDFI